VEIGSPPETPLETATSEFHGVTVAEDYRWLEDFDNPVVKEWNASQNQHTRGYLDALPDRALIEKRLAELLGGGSADYYSLQFCGGRLFAIKEQPPLEQPLLVTLSSPEDPASEQVIIDLNEIDTEGTTAIDFFRPSPDGALVAVSLSRFGSEDGTVFIYNTSDGTRATWPDSIPRVNGPTAGGDVAWADGGTGFYYSRYPHPGERPDEDLRFFQQVYYHRLGTPATDDTYSVGTEFPCIAEIELEASHDGRSCVATVANGDGGEYAHFLKRDTEPWVQITKFDDLIPKAKFAPDGSMFLLSRKDAPRGQMLHMAAGVTDLAQAAVIVPEGDDVIKSFRPTDNQLYIVYMAGGPTRLQAFDHAGKPQTDMPFGQIASIGGLLCTGGDTLLFRSQSYTEPPAWYRFDPLKWEVTRTWLFETASADFRDIEVVREFATSKDGTRVPINILRRKDFVANGQNPTILYGYGGYGISMSPWFDVALRLWFDQGGVYAVANIRGGGEFGEEWHLDGNLTKKQNVFDDFAACAQYLTESGVTNPDRLILKGGSNGGLLMGAMIVQHPTSCRAIYSRVGIYDMLRVELDPNGVFNITEFGTVENPDHFAALHAYSPYHHVEDGTAYPAMMLQTGEHDGRVSPSQSRKMTARLQRATSSSNPILLRSSSDTGHGSGTALSKKIALEADIYSFLMDQLGLRFKHDE
jgi:prolyl oligopeptidase